MIRSQTPNYQGTPILKVVNRFSKHWMHEECICCHQIVSSNVKFTPDNHLLAVVEPDIKESVFSVDLPCNHSSNYANPKIEWPCKLSCLEVVARKFKLINPASLEFLE